MTEADLIQFPERDQAPAGEPLDPRLDGILALLALHCRTPAAKDALGVLRAALLQQEA